MNRRNNGPRSRRPNQSRGMMEQNYGSNMSDRTGALMARPSPFVNDSPFAADRSFGADRSFANDRAFASDRPAPFASEGSLHLQELDLELALLKRKREIIEQQQQLLTSNDSYGRQQSNYTADNPPALMQNYPKYYNDPPVSGHKRRGDSPWQEGSQPKRFSAPQGRRSPNRGQNRSFNTPKPAFRAPESKPKHQPRPSRLKETSFRPSTATQSRGAPAGRGRNFNSTRVTKPKNADSGAKPLVSYPAGKRRELVDKASDLVKRQPEIEEDYLLTADKPPTPRMVGRLELALGSIFKEIQKLHPETAAPLQYLVVRNIKQTIRDRIREVMVGKVVGRHADIIETYRAKYGPETDKQVLESAASKPEAAVRKRKFVDSESPGKYFKANLATILNKKLNEMFDKLKEVYNKEQLKEDIKQTSIEMQKEDTEKLAELEAEEAAAKATANGDFTADVEVTNAEETKEGKEEVKEEKEEAKKEKEADVKKEDGEKKGYRTKYYERLMEDLIRLQLPDVLPRYKEKILALFDIDEEYKKTKASIIMKSEEIASHLADEVKALEDGDIKIVLRDIREKEAKEAAEKRSQRSALLFVKIMGRPYLPKRHLMQDFLNQFTPRSIKRHRNMKNILFVGFESKESFDKILAASESVVGNSTLEIKVSDRTKMPNKDTKDGTAKKDGSAHDDSTATVEKDLDNELDNQIEDLLTSIRQEEENLTVPEEETGEKTEEATEETADKTETDVWENGEGTWETDGQEVTWEGTEGETGENKPAETEAGDGECVENDVECVENDVECVEGDNAAEENTAGNDDDVIEVKDDGNEEQNADTAGRVTTRRSTRLAK